jgi:hypothetical protein
MIKSFCFTTQSLLFAAMLGWLGSAASAAPVGTTTIYGTGQPSTTYAGGTINAGDTVRLNDGTANVTANIVDNGTLDFNQSSGTLTISGTVSGNGTLSLSNTGTLNLTGGSAVGGGVALDMTTSAAAGLLQIRSGTGAFYVGYTGTGSLTLAGGNVDTGAFTISNTSSAFGSVTMSSGTLSADNIGIGSSGTGTFDMTGGRIDCLSPYIGNNAPGVGTFTMSGGTVTSAGSGMGVGYSGKGLLNLNGGSFSNSAGGYVAYNLGSSGTVNVTSGTLAVSTEMSLGRLGNATLNLSGGRVSSGYGSLGSGTSGIAMAAIVASPSGLRAAWPQPAQVAAPPPRADDAAHRGLTVAEVEREYKRQTSLRTFATNEDVTAMVRYLVSPAGARISGQALTIDGHTESLSLDMEA